MGQIHRLKHAALSVLPAEWVPPVAARAALVLDEVELHLLQILCRRAGTSVDVGANLGIYTEILRRNSRAVVAVEPHPALAKHLRRAFRHGVRVVEAALSDAPTVTNIRIPVIHGREVDTRGSLEPAAIEDFQTISRQVDVLTLDMLDIQDVGFIKIDVEGHEREVVDGGMRLLQARHPRLLIELEERHRSGSVEQMVGRLSQLGYRGFFVSGRDLLSVAQYDAGRHQAPDLAKGVRGARSRAYINNFIFLADEEHASIVPRLRQCLERLGGWTKVRHALAF